jgi:hypothetical protein
MFFTEKPGGSAWGKSLKVRLDPRNWVPYWGLARDRQAQSIDVSKWKP